MNKKKIVLLTIITFVVVVIDQITKGYILKEFHHGESQDVIQNFFNITYVRNPGAAFGIMRDLQANYREWFFLIMPPIAMSIIFFMLYSTPTEEKWKELSLCAIFGGALGNYIDRIRFQYVVDFLDFHYYDSWAWPAFNVADISIVCGVTVLILLELQLMKKEYQAKKS